MARDVPLRTRQRQVLAVLMYRRTYVSLYAGILYAGISEYNRAQFNLGLIRARRWNLL